MKLVFYFLSSKNKFWTGFSVIVILELCFDINNVNKNNNKNLTNLLYQEPETIIFTPVAD